jgi:N-acetyltransferase 10
MGYANIFVTSPSPENLRTLFEFIFKGLDALGYKEHIDYDLVESTNPAFGALALLFVMPHVIASEHS